MLLARENGALKIYAETYSLEFVQDRPFVNLEDQSGSRIAELFVLSSIHPLNGRDDTTWIESWRVEESLSEIVCSLETSSSAWQSKTIRFRCQPRRFTYQVEVCGDGQISEANYFGGYYSGQIRWGCGFFLSGQHFKQGFNPEPACAEIYTFPAEASCSLNMTGVPLPGRDDWFFTPPPFCLAFETARGWLSLGVEARRGANSYTDYQYHGSRAAFYLSQAYDGHTRVSGRYQMPAIAFDFGPDPYTLLAAHVQHLRAAGLVPTPAADNRPAWWSEPLFCGWGSQCYLSKIGGGSAFDYANQPSYEAFLHTLSAHGVEPGTIVIDDKWQATYGDNAVDLNKWPDLPGFIRSRHENGQHVLLWLKAWAPEGVPVEECMTNAAGLPVSVDPTHPAFEARLRASVRRMLAPEGYNADGFKIDFSARIPSGPAIQSWGETWGLELMRLYLGIIRDEARRVKPEAMIITHTPHPYLCDLMDVVRLNDINTGADVNRQMTHRARIAAIACPEALIDMDNWPMRDKAAWTSYLTLKPGLGIPALYYASHIDSTGEALTDADYDLLRRTWAEYRAGQSARRGTGEQKISQLDAPVLAGVKHLSLALASKPLKGREKEALPGQV